jgi:hypothetical protein
LNLENRTVKHIIRALIFASVLVFFGCGREIIDSWTVAVSVVDECGEPCPDVWVDVRPNIKVEPYTAPRTNEAGRAFARVREGDVVYLLDHLEEQQVVIAHMAECEFVLVSEEETEEGTKE